MTNTRAAARAQGTQEPHGDLQENVQGERPSDAQQVPNAEKDCERESIPTNTSGNVGPLKAAVEKGLPTIGTYVDILWDDRNQWFRGRVTSRVVTKNKTQAKFHIHYDDGDRITHDLNHFCWRVAPIEGRSGPVCRWRSPSYMLPPIRAFTNTVPVRVSTHSHNAPIQTRAISKHTRASRGCSQTPAISTKRTRLAKRSRTNVHGIKQTRHLNQEHPLNHTVTNVPQNGSALVPFLGECIEADDERSDSLSLNTGPNARDSRESTGGTASLKKTEQQFVNDPGCKSEGATMPPSSVSSSVSHSSYTLRPSPEMHGHHEAQLPEADLQNRPRSEKDDANLPCRKRSWRLHHFSTDV